MSQSVSFINKHAWNTVLHFSKTHYWSKFGFFSLLRVQRSGCTLNFLSSKALEFSISFLMRCFELTASCWAMYCHWGWIPQIYSHWKTLMLILWTPSHWPLAPFQRTQHMLLIKNQWLNMRYGYTCLPRECPLSPNLHQCIRDKC